MASYDLPSLDKAIDVLKTALGQNTPEYWETANEVKKMFPHGCDSLGVPTWFYGFEPTNLFASRVAKYFANSIREAGMLQIARAGVVLRREAREHGRRSSWKRHKITTGALAITAQWSS